MTPQSILADMEKAERGEPDFDDLWVAEEWDLSRHTIEACVHFEFGDMRPTTEHREFAEELFARGQFRLPFDTVLYTGHFVEGLHIGIASQFDGKVMRSHTFMTAGIAQPTLISKFKCDPASDVAVSWTVVNRTLEAFKDDPNLNEHRQLQQIVAHSLHIALGCTVLLMSKEVGQRIEAAPPEKIQAKRIAQGKPPIFERRLVFIRPEFRASFRNGPQGDMRSSPKMHWRRGHFRKLHGGERIVPVAPALIGANEDANAIAPKAYKVGGSPNG